MKIPLLNLSLAISLIGILLLLFLANTQNLQTTNLEDINKNIINKRIKVKGTVFNIRTYQQSNFQVISIKDLTGKIDITLNTNANKNLNLTKNQNITAIGIVKEYKQHLQIQAEIIY